MQGYEQYSVIAENIHQNYSDVKVLKGVNLAVERGAVHGILGPNGAGKSTFVDLCTGSSKPTSGTMQVLGVDPHRNSALVRSHCLLYTSPSPRDRSVSRMPSSA